MKAVIGLIVLGSLAACTTTHDEDYYSNEYNRANKPSMTPVDANFSGKSQYGAQYSADSHKTDFIQYAENKLTECDLKIASWKSMGKKESYISSLEKKCRNAHQELDELKRASIKNYEDEKHDVEKALAKLDDEMREADKVSSTD